MKKQQYHGGELVLETKRERVVAARGISVIEEEVKWQDIGVRANDNNGVLRKMKNENLGLKCRKEMRFESFRSIL